MDAKDKLGGKGRTLESLHLYRYFPADQSEWHLSFSKYRSRMVYPPYEVYYHCLA